MTAVVAPRVAQMPKYAMHLFKPRRYKVCYGGRGASRSWSFARALLIKAAEKKLRVLCTREMQSSLRDSVHQLLRDQIELMELEGYTVTDREIRHENGSLFLFEGLRHNVTKIKSLEGIDICWVEEAERISKESWAILIPTIRKSGSEIWVTFNPDQEDDATYQRFIVTPPKNSWVRLVTWEENPWFPDELREEMEYDYKNDPDSAAHVWEGKTRQVTDAQILKGKFRVEEFEPCVGHSVEHPCVEMMESRTGYCPHAWSGPYQGMDFGFASDPNAAVRAWIYGRVLYIEYEWYRLHFDIDHIANDTNPHSVLNTIPDFADYVTRADSARPDSISFLRRHGLPRIASVKKYPGSVEEGVLHLRSYEAIVIHPRCKHTRDECKHYSYKVDERSGDVLPEIVDKHNHCMDSLRYAVAPLIKPQRKVGVLFVGARASTDARAAIQRAREAEADLIATDGRTADELARDGFVGSGFADTDGHTPNGNGNGHSPNGNTHLMRGLNRR